jgi:hypothetical protein
MGTGWLEKSRTLRRPTMALSMMSAATAGKSVSGDEDEAGMENRED